MNRISGPGMLAALALAFAAAPALAGQTKLSVSGTVSRVAALQNQTSTTPPPGIVGVGDALSLTATFDFSLAQLTATFDADPSVNIYNLPGTSVAFSIGSYTRAFTPRFDFNASIQIWNDRSTPPTDSQSFNFFDFDLAPTLRPFDVGSGLTSASLDFMMFDNTATARTNDLISQIAPVSSFGTKLLSYGLLNSDTGLFVIVDATVTSASLEDASAVPEPASWAMLIIGFGLVGGGLRRHHARVRFA